MAVPLLSGVGGRAAANSGVFGRLGVSLRSSVSSVRRRFRALEPLLVLLLPFAYLPRFPPVAGCSGGAVSAPKRDVDRCAVSVPKRDVGR